MPACTGGRGAPSTLLPAAPAPGRPVPAIGVDTRAQAVPQLAQPRRPAPRRGLSGRGPRACRRAGSRLGAPCSRPRLAFRACVGPGAGHTGSVRTSPERPACFALLVRRPPAAKPIIPSSAPEPDRLPGTSAGGGCSEHRGEPAAWTPAAPAPAGVLPRPRALARLPGGAPSAACFPQRGRGSRPPPQSAPVPAARGARWARQHAPAAGGRGDLRRTDQRGLGPPNARGLPARDTSWRGPRKRCPRPSRAPRGGHVDTPDRRGHPRILLPTTASPLRWPGVHGALITDYGSGLTRLPAGRP